MENKNKNYQDIDKRTFDFSVRVIKMVLSLPNNNIATWKLGGQVISSATSINSNIVQARAGISKKDFTNHMRIALKEAKETKRWLEMLAAQAVKRNRERFPGDFMFQLTKEEMENWRSQIVMSNKEKMG